MKVKKENSMNGHSFALFLTDTKQNQLEINRIWSNSIFTFQNMSTFTGGAGTLRDRTSCLINGDIPAAHILECLFWRNYHG